MGCKSGFCVLERKTWVCRAFYVRKLWFGQCYFGRTPWQHLMSLSSNGEEMHLCHNSGCYIFIILLLLGLAGTLSFVPPAQQQCHCLTLEAGADPLGQGRIRCHWLGPTYLTPPVRGEYTPPGWDAECGETLATAACSLWTGLL